MSTGSAGDQRSDIHFDNRMNAAAVWLAESTDDRARAQALSIPTVATAPATGFYLQSHDAGLTLYNADAARPEHGLRLDLCDGEIERRAQGGRRSPLARATGIHRRPGQQVLDATCGLGRDSATLAALGCRVNALERSPLLYALLEDAHRRAAIEPPSWLARWPTLAHADATAWLARAEPGAFDVIYIDPMFEAPRRKARPQKALDWLHRLLGADTDAARLLAVARGVAGRRCVVKQHARADALAPADLSFGSKSVRYDVYLAPYRDS